MVPFLSSHPYLVTILSILLLNPLPLISGAPTDTNVKLLRQKRHINFNNDDILINRHALVPEQGILFEGLLGCKYDSDVCNRNEVCFDDALFGQCWDGEGSARKAFALQNDIYELANEKLAVLEYTINILNRYHLNWKDHMTQCLLLHILTDQHHHELNRHRLESFYHDCLTKDKLLANLAAMQEETNFLRRQINENKRYHYNPYPLFTKSKNSVFDLDTFFDNLSAKQINEQSRLSLRPSTTPEKQMYITNEDIILEEQPIELKADESQMNEPTKISIPMNEGHSSLVETLQINNNKQVLPLLSGKTMITKNNETTNSIDTDRYFTVEAAHGYIIINRDFKDQIEGARLLALLTQINSWPTAIFTELNTNQHTLTFHVVDNAYRINASSVAQSVFNNQKFIEIQLGIHIIDVGIGKPNQGAQLSVERQNGSRSAIIILVTCALVLSIMAAFVLFFFVERNERIRNKFVEITQTKHSSSDDYQDLCRQRMETQSAGRKSSETRQVTSIDKRTKHNSDSSSSRSSTSSWTEEPVTSVNMDILTGHLILSYMEDHLRDRHRLEAEWQSLCNDENNEERESCSIALSETNDKKNRYLDCIPYDYTRVQLENDEYINASTIFDSHPKCKYIATQGPMPSTTNTFWQLVWEQGSCVIVALTRPIENGITMCHHYWPVEGCAQYNDFEVNLVSEHIWSEDYVVRSFYLRNIQTMETRTVTQFQFLTWDELCNPPSAKSVLDFRRKVNKCFRGQSSPIIVHCNDGVGRTGTYILLDTVLNRICKGAREINIAATLEHLRDQRAKMVKTKEQFQFVFVAVAEEVTNLLKALPQ